MKYGKIFRTLALAIVLALLVIAIPASPALAQTIYCTPNTGTVNTTVTVTGTGFYIYTGQTVYILYNYNYIRSATVVGGTFSASFPVPSYPTVGIKYITAQHTTHLYDLTKQIGITYFTVTQAAIVITPSSTYVGETVTVNGTGFAASSAVTITFAGVVVVTNPLSVTTDTNGSFTATFTAPESYRGSHTVQATDASNNLNTAIFTTTQSITIIPTSGVIGDEVAISGTGFRASQPITITFAGVVVVTNPLSVTTDTNGSFSASFNVPPRDSGIYVVEASDGIYKNSVNFTISASVSLSQTTGYVGTEITISGTGFRASQPITITFANINVGTASTDANGSFSGKFTVLSFASGTYVVEASDGINTDSVNFTISVSISLSQTTGNVGTELAVSGIGFIGTVIIKYDDTEVATTTADANGAFSTTFTAPPSVSGNHTVTASDSINTLQTIFTMESEAPPIPVPLLPEMDVKAKAEAHLDWEDVTDLSGVTYTLQIATDENFTEDSVLLEKVGLTDSEYTLTKDEKLESTKKEAPYYWRAKAIDDASNESEWTIPRSFYVGFSFSMPDWAKYTLMGLGGLLLLALGVWIGRKTAYLF